MAQVDYFLKIEGIDGESTDASHKGEIEILSFSWGVTNPSSIGSQGGGAGAGKVSLSDFHFTTKTSKASPALFLNAVNGKHLKIAVLTARKAGGKQGVEFLKITMEDVLVSSYQSQGSDSEVPSDQASLNFGKVTVSFQPQRADGSVDNSVTGSWDVRPNVIG